ncbi:glycosyltransferase family 2 protein [Dactylosporangium vinaceum]|uniref:Glycosyltransferase family 2 protein n=1 Tax=Dactylosporangium vinaceum TaxID=53362 RepID=A0ABV5MRF3_9ACTN|nr:glycosyltransferase family 2 protein [Dactylosporangium vinaceum]UAC00463.1 glycosyltransferase family 2 protein [Dactylosporangium vinaceum]
MIVLLPVFRPSFRLVELLTGLGAGMPVVIVDDGSGTAAASIFDSARGRGATVLSHPVNRGKGAALKTGVAHIADVWPGRGVVCADADGQHSVEDIRRVAQHAEVTGRITLGARRFGSGTPLRSRFGNLFTAALFQAVSGTKIRDTQTGLRAFPATLLQWLLTVPGDGFDYEMQMLLAALEQGHPIDEVDIATTYIDGNSSSHFGALSDSARVYRPLLRSIARR